MQPTSLHTEAHQSEVMMLYTMCSRDVYSDVPDNISHVRYCRATHIHLCMASVHADHGVSEVQSTPRSNHSLFISAPADICRYIMRLSPSSTVFAARPELTRCCSSLLWYRHTRSKMRTSQLSSSRVCTKTSRASRMVRFNHVLRVLSTCLGFRTWMAGYSRNGYSAPVLWPNISHPRFTAISAISCLLSRSSADPLLQSVLRCEEAS